jgi:hypothetical protein
MIYIDRNEPAHTCFCCCSVAVQSLERNLSLKIIVFELFVIDIELCLITNLLLMIHHHTLFWTRSNWFLNWKNGLLCMTKKIWLISGCAQCFRLRLFLDFIRSDKAITQVLSMKSIPLLKHTSDFLVAVCRPQYFSAIASFQSRRQ